ncbi:MAG TPA: hypothetical protein VGL06_02255 [Pseudonocardiaceae bacterium]
MRRQRDHRPGPGAALAGLGRDDVTTSAPGVISIVDQLLTGYAGAAGLSDRVPLLRVAGREPGLVPLLASRWALAGIDLPAGFGDRVTEAVRRCGHYAELFAELAAQFPGVLEIKGAHLGGRYPVGLVRGQADLDLLVPDVLCCLEIISWLLDAGWALRDLRTWADPANRQQFNAFLHREVDGLLVEVELRTCLFEGDQWRYAPRPAGGWRPTGPAGTALCVLEEATTRRFRCRDIVDWTLLEMRMSDQDRAGVPELAHRFGLAGELRRLLALLRRSGGSSALSAPFTLPRPPYWVRSVAAPSRLIPLVNWQLGLSGSPVSLRGPVRLLHRMGWVSRAWATGAPFFGIQVDDTRLTGAFRTQVRRNCVLMDTPFGRLAFSAGCDLDADWL